MDNEIKLTKSQEQIIEQLRVEFMKINGQEKDIKDSPLGMLAQAVRTKIEREKYIKTMQEMYEESLAEQTEKNIAHLNAELKEFGLCATKSGNDIRVCFIDDKLKGSFVIQQFIKREKSDKFGDYLPCGIGYKSYSPAVDSCASFDEYLSKDAVAHEVKKLYESSLM
jgi:hypothetical protein